MAEQQQQSPGDDSPLEARLRMMIIKLKAEAKAGPNGYTFGQQAACQRAGELAEELEKAIAEVRVLGKSHSQTYEERRLYYAIADLRKAEFDETHCHDVMTYKNQPNNLEAWRFGEACRRAAEPGGGDFIDLGLSLMLQLHNRGYGIVRVPKREEGK